MKLIVAMFAAAVLCISRGLHNLGTSYEAIQKVLKHVGVSWDRTFSGETFCVAISGFVAAEYTAPDGKTTLWWDFHSSYANISTREQAMHSVGECLRESEFTKWTERASTGSLELRVRMANRALKQWANNRAIQSELRRFIAACEAELNARDFQVADFELAA